MCAIAPPIPPHHDVSPSVSPTFLFFSFFLLELLAPVIFFHPESVFRAFFVFLFFLSFFTNNGRVFFCFLDGTLTGRQARIVVALISTPPKYE